MKIFLDTNVVMDYLASRGDVESVNYIFKQIEDGVHSAYISIGSVYTITYLTEIFLKTKGMDKAERLQMLRTTLESLLDHLKIAGHTKTQLLKGVRDIDFHSVCEHHWLPFSGKVTIGYVPNLKVVGLSKIPRVVKYFSQKPQLQEQLTNEIGEYLADLIHPLALYVVAEATHQCVACRGAESDCSTHTMFRYCCDSFDDSEYYRDWVCRM